MTPQDVRKAKAMLADPEVSVSEVAAHFGVSRTTLYNYVGAVAPIAKEAMMIDRVGNNLFGVLRFLAVLCAGIGVVTLFTAGVDLGWPWLRAAALCATPVIAPVFFARLFEALAARAVKAAARHQYQ